MISSLRGRVLHTEPDSVVIEVGGVGFQVAVTSQVVRAARVGEELRLHTSLIVREDALALFGFTEREELIVFSQLLSVTGVGPKSALGVLSTGEAVFLAAMYSFYNADDGAAMLTRLGADSPGAVAAALDEKRRRIIADLTMCYAGW